MRNSCIAADCFRTLARSFARFAPGVLPLGWCVLTCAQAHAAPGDQPMAQALFEEARALMNSQHVEEACLKFAESQRLDPASGTLLNLAVCHEKQGRTATAWSEYNDVVAAARRERNQERERIASERIREVEPKLCHLSVVSGESGTERALVIKVDGVT